MPRSKAEREKALERDRVCQICGVGPREGVSLEVHHVKKMGMGGRKNNDVADNMITLCRRCHLEIEAGKWKITSLWPLEVTTPNGPLQDLYRNFAPGFPGAKPDQQALT